MFCHLRRGIPAVLLSFQLFAHHGVAAWTWRDPSPQGNSLAAIAYSPALDTSVAIGDFGACVLKAGSGAWASVPAFSGNQSLSSVVWANNRFLAAGGTAGLWTSANGTEWAQGQSGVSGSIIAGETGKIAVLSGNQVWVSDDASAWTPVPLPPPPDANSHYRALAFLGGTFVATGDAGLVARSVDGGRTWSAVSSGSSSNLYYLAAGSGKFVASGWYYTNAATGEYSAQVIHSTDGQTWAAGTIPTPPAGNYFYSVLPVASGFLAGASAGLFFSQDGSQWSAVQGAPTDFYPAGAAGDGATGTILVGNRGGIFRLDSSLAWERQTSGAINGTFLWLPRFSSAALGNLVLAKDDNRRASAIYRSDDAGTTWTEQSGDVFLRQMSGLTTSGSRIMAYSDGDGGTRVAGVYSTTDGTTWQLVTPSAIPWSANATFTRVNSLAANNSESSTLALVLEATFNDQGSFVATRKLYRSTAWGEWSPVRLAALTQPPPQEDNVETAFWDGSRFVMLLYPGRIFTSPDGLRWTQLPALPKDSPTTLSEYAPTGAPAANTAFAVASNGPLLVARSKKLGTGGSPGPWANGYARFFSFVKGKWQEGSVQTSSESTDLTQISWDGAAFLAPVFGGLLTSSDAVTWTEREVGASLPAIVPTASSLVGFSYEMAVLTSPVGDTSLAPSSRIVPAAGEGFDVSVTSSDFSWSAVPSVPWISVSAQSGAGNATLDITVQPNTATAARSGSVKIGRATLSLTQHPKTPILQKNLAGTASSFTIPFSGSWSAQADQPWATTPATGSGPVKVNFSANPSSSSRVVNVVVNGIVYSFTQAGSALPASYSGAVGELGEILPPALDGTNQPLAPHFQSVTGSLALTVASPSPTSPDGAYTATLNLFNGTSNAVFRAKGNLSPGGILQNVVWSTGGRTPQTVTVSLSPLANGSGSQGLAGTVIWAGHTHDVLAGKQIYNAKSNSWPAAGSLFTTTFPVTDDAYAGTGSCTVAVSTSGIAKVVGRLGDGSALTMSSPVWGATGAPSEKVLFLAAPLANNLGFIGGWLARQDAGSGPWNGGGTCAAPAFVHSISPAMSPYAKPAPNSPAANWPTGATLNVVNSDSLNLGGTVTINSANKLAVTPTSGHVTISLALNPATGAVSGQCSYLPLGTLTTTKATATIFGVLDQSSSRIDGLVIFSPANTGILEIVP